MTYPAPYTEPGSSDPDEETLPSRVCKGATIGAGCTIGNDLTIGQFGIEQHLS